MSTRQPLYVILMAGVLTAALLLRIWDPAPVARLRLSVFDTFLAQAPRTPDPAMPVRIVDIDEASLADHGQWPWPRTRLAEMIDRLRAAEAATISVDLILAEPDRLSPENVVPMLAKDPALTGLAERVAGLATHDQVLADAIRPAPVILGFSAEKAETRNLAPPRAPYAIGGDDPKEFVPHFPGGVGSLPILAEAATGLGAVNWLPESDQVVRRVPLLITAGETLYPSLALETLRVATDRTATVHIRSSGASGILAFGQRTGVDSIRVGNVLLPSDARGELWLKYAPQDPRRTISARDLLAGRVANEEIAGRHIFIGSSATGLMDLRATPLTPSLPGVEIHAQALEQMLSGDHLVRPAWATGAEIVFLALAGLAAAWLIGRSGAVVAAAASVAAIAGVGLLSSWAFSNAGLLFDPVYPSLALVAVYLTGSLANYIRSESDRAQIRSAFGHYVSPAIVEELARTPERLKLGGERRDVTLLFADVRGFSRLSEGMDAEALVRFINTLFTPLADTILDHSGTIDKFMGDAVMAFWNAPLTDPDHANKACRAALAMQAAMAAYNLDRGSGQAPVRLGIGINTGACVVGNVGSPQRFDYSVLGDTVNTASRLEETTKTYGVPVIAGADTAAAARALAFVEIGTAPLRGKDRPERLFALIGDESVAQHPKRAELAAGIAAFAAAMSAGDMATARTALEGCRRLGIADAATILEAAQLRLNG